ncbi:MarR family winged helix-turn-helix transcriptional regulator [Gymnodinialimonas sp. 2305UL16-5]|uniref:MarR family winged helix-turn-helix transcriptional regulator n=1 Tax=Gymnodinialimonas mytili TaxID=3126503 RepID=UPI0030A61825
MDDIYAMPGHLIRRLQQISVSVFTERMRDLGQTLTSPQFATLAALEAKPGIDQATLAGMIAHDRATIGGVVERLEGKGLVERRQNPADRRAKVLSLTTNGARLLAELRPVVTQLQADILPGLTQEERHEFVRLAAKVALAGNDFARAPLVMPDKKPQGSTD